MQSPRAKTACEFPWRSPVLFNLSSEDQQHQCHVRDLLRMQVLGPPHRPTESRLWGWGRAICFNKPSRCFCGQTQFSPIPEGGVHGLAHFSPKWPVCPLLPALTPPTSLPVGLCSFCSLLWKTFGRFQVSKSISPSKSSSDRHTFWQIPEILPPGTFFPPLTSAALFSSLLSLSLPFLFSFFWILPLKQGFFQPIIYLGLKKIKKKKKKKNVCAGHTPEQLNENSRMKAIIMYFKSSPDNFNVYPKLSLSLLQWPQETRTGKRWIYS